MNSNNNNNTKQETLNNEIINLELDNNELNLNLNGLHIVNDDLDNNKSEHEEDKIINKSFSEDEIKLIFNNDINYINQMKEIKEDKIKEDKIINSELDKTEFDTVIYGGDIGDNFIKSTLKEVKIITMEDRQKEIKKHFLKFKRSIKNHLKKSNEYLKKIEENEHYERTTEKELIKQIKLINVEFVEHVEHIHDEPDEINETYINEMFDKFDIIFNNFITVREHYRPFIFNPSNNKLTSKIFILKGINFTLNKSLWFKSFNQLYKNNMFNSLIINLCNEIDNIKDKIRNKNELKLIEHIKKIDEEKNKLIKYIKNYKFEILEEFDKHNLETIQNLKDIGSMTNQELEATLKDFHEEAIRTSLNMVKDDGDLMKIFYYVLSEIITIYNDYSRENWNDYETYDLNDLTEDYKTLISKIEKLFKHAF